MKTTAVPLRDLDSYQRNYAEHDFEHYLASVRRKLILDRLKAHTPKSVLEVGCAQQTIFSDYVAERGVVIEPSAEFAKKARADLQHRTQHHVVNDLLEEAGELGRFDFILVSAVLHEVVDQTVFLNALKNFCGENTLLLFVSPNARSLHRQLAVEMGLIKDCAEISRTQEWLQQKHPFPTRTEFIARINSSGFRAFDDGGILLKPFSHGQMQVLIDNEFANAEMLRGLCSLGEQYPDLASEFWIEAKLNV